MSDLPKFVFCIAHHEMVKIEHGACVGHTYEVPTSTGIEIDFCELPEGYAYCPPPPDLLEQLENCLDIYHQWADWCFENQPDVDEQLIMDLQAADLLADLEAQ